MVVTTVTAGRHAEPVTEPPEPEVPERATRRTYTAQYKLRILAEYERRDCRRPWHAARRRSETGPLTAR